MHIIILSYILSININVFFLFLIMAIFYYNYTIQHHEQRCCWNGAIDKQILLFDAGESSSSLTVSHVLTIQETRPIVKLEWSRTR